MKKFIKILILTLWLPVIGQQTPASTQQKSILITNAFLHIGDGTTISDAVLGFKDGKITFIGKEQDAPSFDLKIDAKGQHLYPGFIATNSSIGLVEIDAIRATRDEDEIGDFLPHIRTAIAYDAESKIVESMRPNGVLIAQVSPRGGLISGSSSVMQLDAWNWEDAIITTDEGIHLHGPNPYSRGRSWLGEGP